MSLTQLTLHNFRNYPALRLDAAAGFMIFTGENGAGKTNILEAISLLAPGRGLRRASLQDVAHDQGPGDFAVAAQMGDIQLGTGTVAATPERRKTRINEATVATNDLAQWLAILWLTPAMDRLFMEGAASRRNFLDRLVTAVEPTHARHCSRYESLRRERNRLLSHEQMPDPQWLDAVEEQLSQYGSLVAEARQRMVEQLNGALAGEQDGLFAIPTIELADRGLRSQTELRQSLLSGRRLDRAAGRTLHGPHRADLIVRHAAKQQPADRCSTGEQKALLFSIILAHADLVTTTRSARPILLLDEVAAHLDPRRRSALFEKLTEKGGQVWLTGTEVSLFDGVPADSRHFLVTDGNIRQS